MLDRNPESRAFRRVKIMARLAVLWAGVLVLRLVYLQVFLHDDIEKIVLKQYLLTQEVELPRGKIVDRNGQTLAISAQVDSISINPRQTPDLDVAREILSPILDLDSQTLRDRIEYATRNNRGFLWIKRKITPEESRRLRSLDLAWLQFVPEYERSYPNGTLAAQVIGSVDHAGVGNSGLEQSLDDELRGEVGKQASVRDARHRDVESEVLAEAQPGANIGISIDERIQFVADRALDRAAAEAGVHTGSVVVLDPSSGEILAMSNYPTYDPNTERITADDVAARKNSAISAPFEPGSVFKIVTLSAGLETTNLTPDSMIDCGPGVMRLFGRPIHDTHAYGTIPLKTVLAKSSNIGAIQVGLRVGPQKLLEYVRRFGFGRRTGIPLPGESPGLVHPLSQWGRTSIGSVAMGHEVLTTSLQLALATAVFANGGTLPEPRLILWRQRPGEGRVMEPLAARRRVVDPDTAMELRRMMEGVVLNGTGQRARVHGYSTGGKTGSAQIYDPELHRYTHEYNSSFVGFAPVQDPKIVVAVTLNGASKFGGVVSAPVFQDVASETLRILGITPDVLKPEPEPPPSSNDDDLADLAIADLGGDQAVEMETASAGVTAGTEVSAYLEGPEVPDLYGLTLRDVLARCKPMGLDVEYQGAGMVRWQDPSPGSVLPPGRAVRVRFAR